MSVVVRRDDKLYNYSFAVIERPAQTTSTVGRPTTSTANGNSHVAEGAR